jgi:hypothetical protein
MHKEWFYKSKFDKCVPMPYFFRSPHGNQPPLSTSECLSPFHFYKVTYPYIDSKGHLEMRANQSLAAKLDEWVKNLEIKNLMGGFGSWLFRRLPKFIIFILNYINQSSKYFLLKFQFSIGCNLKTVVWSRTTVVE